jgi:hypothetical protein
MRCISPSGGANGLADLAGSALGEGIPPKLVTRDLHFSADADYSRRQGKVVPERLNGWRKVGPLESLAGARPTDNMIVMLNGTVQVEERIPSGSGGTGID